MLATVCAPTDPRWFGKFDRTRSAIDGSATGFLVLVGAGRFPNVAEPSEVRVGRVPFRRELSCRRGPSESASGSVVG